MNKIVSALMNVIGELRERASPLLTAAKRLNDGNRQRDSASWMRDGYRTSSVPGGVIRVAEEPESAYFAPEAESPPRVFQVR